MSHRIAISLCLAGIAGALLLVFCIQPNWFGGNSQQATISTSSPTSTADNEELAARSKEELAGLLGIEKEGFTSVGGVERPQRDVAFEQTNPSRKRGKSVLPNPGKAPYLSGNENPQVAGLLEELNNQDEDPDKTAEVRTAKSTFFVPEAFDREEFDANPDAYLNKIRPGRVFQPAQPGPETKQLTALSSPFTSVIQSESVLLKVKADPGAPVAFHTQQTGTFENRLKSITVAADQEGVAEAKFTLGPGTSGLVNVLAASPLHSQQVKFTVRVALPTQQ